MDVGLCQMYFQHISFSSLPAYMVGYSGRFPNVKQVLSVWDKSHLFLVCKFFLHIDGFYYWCFMEDFCICAHERYFSDVFFLVMPSVLHIKVILASENKLEHTFSAYIFPEKIVENRYIFSLNIWWNPSLKTSESGN